MEKVIPNFSKYCVTDKGVVFSMKFGKRRKLKITKSRSGYSRVGIRHDDGKPRTVEVHRLVALTFIRRPKNKEAFIVNHKNGKKTDNRVKNLEWVTPKGNSHHYVRKLRGRQITEKVKKKDETKQKTLKILQMLHKELGDNTTMFHNLVGTILEG